MINRGTSDSGGRSRLGEGLEGRTNRVSDEEFRDRNAALRIDKETGDKGTKKAYSILQYPIKCKLNEMPLLIFLAESVLKTETVDFHHQENRKAHKTDDYELQELIIRRGQVFDVTLTFNRDYNPDNDVIVIQFATGIFCLSSLLSQSENRRQFEASLCFTIPG